VAGSAVFLGTETEKRRVENGGTEYVITECHPMINPKFNLAADHYPAVSGLERCGYVKVPNWMPVGISGYDWRIVNGIEAMMRPEPTEADTKKYKKDTP
jgi:hypothetical protein